ncbi:MAG: L-serine ammonia-lyase, iron-sulfur-dependent, subunit alpha [Thermoanaerobaculaceae bacterium]|jgi:L-cysteine desulfidase|nr:L-serine ammonia-lyase, iron-sulfur-dependent, subunit alpha [Thermoanaerobaculaceae bacterium]
MNIIHEIFAHEVFPAMGCTEPISCAYASAAAAEQLGGPVERLELTVDPGTFKNGAAVTIPNSEGRKGNVIAAAMGAIIARSSLQMEILKGVSPEVLADACRLVDANAVQYRCRDDEKGFYVEVVAERGGSRVRCIVKDGHTNIICLEKDGVSVLPARTGAGHRADSYRDRLRAMTLEELLHEVVQIDDDARRHIQAGIDMNLSIAEKGIDLKRSAWQLQHMMKQGLISNDLFYQVKQRVASALDARMGGLPEPVMTSGGSGNQGILTILLPYLVGRHMETDLPRIQESIAVSHAVNAYIKCYTGELSVVCGCAIAASIAAASAVVYQRAGIDMVKITNAIDTIVADLCGIICDGAKAGCSMKIVTGADTALRSAFMALDGYGVSVDDGVVGRSAEESIRNLSKISLEGMGLVDSTVVGILQGKTPRSGHA